MNTKYVVSLELAKQLKDCGVPQESEWYWVYTMGSWELQNLTLGKSWAQDHWEKVISAFHTGELEEQLPEEIHRDDERLILIMRKRTVDYCMNGDLKRSALSQSGPKPEALGKMLLYLKKERLI